MSGAVLLGLLGCGRAAGRFYVPAIGRLTNARLTAAYDPQAERRQFIARSAPGCRPFDSVEALIEARVVDAVVIASSPDAHGTLAVRALGAGLPVLLDPPLASSPEEGEWIREAERIVHLPVMVAFNRRWWAPVERVRRALGSRAQFEVTIDSVLVSDPRDADPVQALTPHLDLARHLLEREIATVTARREAPQDVEARVTFQGGGVAVCRARLGDRPEERITIHAGRRSFEIRAGSERFWPVGGPGRRALDLADSAPRRVLGHRDGLARSYEAMLAAFVERVGSRAGVGPGTSDGMAIMRAIEAVRRSLAQGGVQAEVPPMAGG